MKQLIVFDFDGVVADSETIANTVLAELVTELGCPMSVDDSMRTFMGKRAEEVIASAIALTDRMPADRFAAELSQRTLAQFRRELREIAGVREYLAAFPQMKR